MKIASWNVNSVRIRGHILKRYVEQAKPDVLCLQETKVEDKDFPHDLVSELGFKYHLFSGQKSYNGVAIFSKVPLTLHSTNDVSGSGAARHIAATLPNGIEIHNFYVPAGGDIPDPKENEKFDDKLKFVAGMTKWSKTVSPKKPVVILGDMNIAPYEHDVWSSKQLRDVVSHTPIEREKMLALRDTIGWIDAARHFTPMEEKLYSWWSYRNRDWKVANRGRRLDHIWVTPALKSALKGHTITKETRDWESTSDHVPILLELKL
jgi:exodeoxyribonuclease-3